MHLWRKLLFLVLITGMIKHTYAQNFYLVKDVNGTTDGLPANISGNKVSEFALLNGVAYFSADDGLHGPGLWRSDGTPEGTYQLKDGIGGSNIVAFRGNIFFTGDDRGLWKSDGTAAGTVPVFDTLLDGMPAQPSPSELVVFNDRLFFSPTQSTLWQSDGTRAGTSLVKNLNQLNNTYSIAAPDYKVVKGRLYFSAFDNGFNRRLLATDGTSEGTYLVSSEVVEANQLTPVSEESSDHSVYFTAASVHGGPRSLFLSHGQPGTVSVAPGFSGTVEQGDFFLPVSFFNGSIFYVGRTSEDSLNVNLYRYDTVVGIQTIFTISGHQSDGKYAGVNQLALKNGKLLFGVFDANRNEDQLWGTDAADPLPVLLKSGLSSNLFNIQARNAVYFAARDSLHGYEMWKTDGTSQGTSIVSDINPGINSSEITAITQLGEKLLFSAKDGVHGIELWISDGTPNGTFMLKDINQSATSPSRPINFSNFNNVLVFTANNDGSGSRLWRSDGTREGTFMIYDTVVVANMYHSRQTNELYINGSTVSGLSGLFKINGTAGSLVLVKEFPPATSVAVVGVADNVLYLQVYNTLTGEYQLWRSDGTRANTFVLKTGQTYSQFDKGTAVGSLFFFVNLTGNELWKTDGTVAGTNLVRPFNGSPKNLCAYKNNLFFTAEDATGSRLWKSDGTTDHTTKVLDDFTNPDHLMTANGLLFFSGIGNKTINGDVGTEMYRSDGTQQGTSLVADLFAGAQSYFPQAACGTDSVLYFFMNGPVYNTKQLWRTDGTRARTQLVTNMGVQYRNPVIASFPTRLFFVSDSSRLWVSDGNAGGTHPMTDEILGAVRVSSASVLPSIQLIGDLVYISAEDYRYGDELYAGYAGIHRLFMTISDGLWNDPAIWKDHIVPSADADVVINNNVIANVNATCTSIRIKAPGTFTINSGVDFKVLQ